MNIYIYPKEIIAIEGKPEAKVPALGHLPAAICPPRVTLELERGSVEIVLTQKLALLLSGALCKAFPVEALFDNVMNEAAVRYADQHAAEFATGI